MSLYDEASLVMIPSGYKEDKLYSIKPTSGDGDFTFSRGTDTATRVNASGLIEKERGNLLLQSNTFSNAAWVKLGNGTGSTAVVTSGFSDPDGGSNAWRLQCDLNGGTTSSDQSLIYQLGSATGVFAFSYYVKSNTGADQDFAFGNGLAGGNFTTATATTSWQRFDTFFNCAVNNTSFIGARGIMGTDDTLDILIYAAQLEQGLVATDYIETTTAAVYEGITDNLPRLDYSGGASCPSLLLEPQRTNLIEQSEYFSASTWVGTTGGTLTENDTTSPEGVVNATKFEGDGSSSSIRLYDFQNFASAGDYSLSFFAKAGTADFIQISLLGYDGGGQASFDLSNGTIDDVANGSIEDYGNGWYRCTCIKSIGATDLTGSANLYVRKSLTANWDNAAEANGKYVYIYGAQLEAGSYPTSYIPTYGTSATRAKDSSEATGLGSSLGSTEGTIFLEVSALTNDLSERRFALSNGTTGNVARVGFTNVSNRILAVLYNGSNQCVLAYEGADITQTNKIAFTYAANDFALYVNGESRRTDTSGSTFTAGTLTEVHFNEGDGNGNESYGNFKQVVIFPTRLTNAELASLTTL